MKDETKDAAARQVELLALEERTRQGAGHPSVRRLIACHSGELAEAEAEEVRDHMAVCPRCVQTLRELSQFLEVMEADELVPWAGLVPTAEETEASWQAVRPHLAPALPGAAQRETVDEIPAPVVRVLSGFRRFGAWPAASLAVAAALALSLGGLMLWSAMRWMTENRLLLAVSVPGMAEVMRGGETGRQLTVRFETEAALLALPLPHRQPFPAYRVEIRSPGGLLQLEATVTPAVVAAPPAAQPQPTAPLPRLLTVVVAAHQLAPGNYRVRILGMRDGRGEMLSEYPLRVQVP